jgi:TolB-like protein/class 3 adenylate cyclase/Tfp pilus assembly protein PilF
MAEERSQRRLAAIMAADVVGYSHLMEHDEAGTLAALKQRRREILQPLVAEHHGRIVKVMGDGVLVEFTSAVNAVACAAELQKRMAAANNGLADDRHIVLRIGINLGDVVVEGSDIYGDAVIIATRLEGMAEAGGICVSAKVREEVARKLEIAFEDCGERQLKNITTPVRVYAAAPAPSLPAVRPLPLPDKPSIAVLPFDDMSDDHAQEYFSDGIAEDLTTALSRFEWLFVIARNSAFTYKGKAVDVRRIGRELGVRYVLEGSVRRSGNRVRINAQLIDAGADHHVWAQRYEREIGDLFELQDDIVASIATTVGPEITLAEITRTRGKRPDDFDAWDHYLRALSAYHRMTKEDVEAAIADLEKAIQIDSEFANAHALLGLCHVHVGMRGWVRPVRPAFERARHWVDQAVRLAPTNPETHQSLAFVLAMTGHAEDAIRVAKIATDLNPNFAEAYAVLGQSLILCGELEGGLAACRMAERGSPRDSSRGTFLYAAMGQGYFFLGDYERAIETSKKGLHHEPSLFGALIALASTYAQLGRNDEARHYVNELLRHIPRYSLRALRKNPMFVAPDLIEKLVDSMRLAGLPE